MGTPMLLVVVPWLALWLAILPPPVAVTSPVTCTQDECLATPPPKSKQMADCCLQKHGCPCGHYGECQETFQGNGGSVPPNGEFYTDYGRTRCTCKGDRKLECVPKPCPVIPKDCKDTRRLMDTCAYCADPAPAQ